MERNTTTVTFIVQLLFRSLLFVGVYQVLGYQIRVWKRNRYFNVTNLFKIELFFHVIVKLWVLDFVSLCDVDTLAEANATTTVDDRQFKVK